MPAVIRRRIALLLVALALPAGLVLAGVGAAWPLLAVPLAIAVPLAGVTGMVAVTLVAGAVVAFASGQPGGDATAMALGLGAFVATGIAVGLLHAVQVAAADRARAVALADRLTALANDEFFLDALERESARARRYGTPLTVMVLDLDRFVDFNRRFGGAVGDAMLRTVGEIVAAGLPRCDLAARLDDGQFAVLVPADEREASERAELLRAAVAAVTVPASRGRMASTTISVGVAGVRAGDDEAGTAVLDRAERALDEAKAGGRDRVEVFSPEHQRWASAAA